MKIFTLAAIFCALPFLTLLADNNGRINRIKSGVYQLSYPDQSMHLFFNYFPNNGLENMFSEIELSDNQQYEIVFILKQFIDQLPAEFIQRFLDIEIFLLRIQNENDFGYTFNDQVVVEISKMRRGSSFANSIQTSFAHELAHLIEKDEDTKSGAAAMKNYLKNIRSTNFEENIRSTNIYDHGYVSRYASGELSKGYNPNEEFAEMFAHLLCVESRWNLFNYLGRDGGSVLNVKVDRYIKFLEYNLPYLGEEYLTKKTTSPELAVSSYESLDGELLLESHEQKSNESMNFESMDEYEEPLVGKSSDNMPNWEDDLVQSDDDLPFRNNDMVGSDDVFARRNDDMVQKDDDMSDLEERLLKLEASIDVPRESPQAQQTVYRYSPEKDDFSQDEPPKESKKQKRKTKKKKKGASWLLIGTAIYVALQLMK